jgi:hypothetical protein
LEFTKIDSHSDKFLTVLSFFFVLARILFKYLQISPCNFYRAYLGCFSSVFSVLCVHAIVSKRRLVLCHYFVLLVLFGDYFLFILVVCLYVMIVEHRERSVQRIWRSRRARVWAAEFCWRQVLLDACPLVLHNMHLNSLYLFFLLALTLTGTY